MLFDLVGAILGSVFGLMSLFDSSMQFVERNYEKIHRKQNELEHKKRLLHALKYYVIQKGLSPSSDIDNRAFSKCTSKFHPEITFLDEESVSVTSDVVYSF